MSRPTVPICSNHGREMGCIKTGRLVRFDADFGPYEIWAGDEFECPTCGNRVVVNFADEPVARHFEASFDAYAKRAEVSVVAR